MIAIEFKEQNTVYVAEGCGDLPTCKYQDENSSGIVSCWEPDDTEMEYIKDCISKGEKPKIYLDMLCGFQPPVYVGCNIFQEVKVNE